MAKGINKVLYIFSGIAIMMCLGTVYSWSIFRLPIESMYNIGAAKSGLPYMTSLFFYALSMLFSGKYIDRYSPRIITSLGGIIVAIGWFLSSYAGNIYILIITYGVIMGVGVGIVYGVPIAVAARWYPHKKGLIVGFVLVGFGLSPFVTAPIAQQLIENYGVLSTFRILGIAFAILIPLFAYPLRYPVGIKCPISRKKQLGNTRNISTAIMVRTQSFKGLYLNFTFGTMIGLMIIGMTNNVGVELIGLSSQEIAVLMSLFAVFNGIGRPVFGWLTDLLSHRTAMLLSYSLITLAAVLMLIANTGSVTLYVIAFSIFWFNLGGWLAIAPTSTLTLYGTKHYSQNYGVVFTAYGIGAIIGVYVSGIIRDAFFDYSYVFYFIIAICVLGIITSQMLIKDKIREAVT